MSHNGACCLERGGQGEAPLYCQLSAGNITTLGSIDRYGEGLAIKSGGLKLNYIRFSNEFMFQINWQKEYAGLPKTCSPVVNKRAVKC